MATKVKIKIKDNVKLRSEIDELYEKVDQICLAKWSLKIAKRILRVAGIEYKNIDAITEGFKTNELWQKGKVRMHDVRQAGFKIHRLARDSDSEIQKTAFRTVGQAVASGHMKEHAMVASDYAIKTIGLITNNDIDAITKERRWQSNELNRLKNEIVPLAQMEVFQPIASLISKSEKAQQKLALGTWQHSMLEKNLKALRIARVLMNKDANDTDNFSIDSLQEALRTLASMMSKVEKTQTKFSLGTSQYTLVKNRLKSLRIALSLINESLNGKKDGKH